MNLRRQPWLLAATVGVVLLAAWWWLRPHGPTYQGRDVRGWLAVQPGFDGPEHLGGFNVTPETLLAFRQMGPDAVPVLAKVALDQRSSYPHLAWAPGLMNDRPPSWTKVLPAPVFNWLVQQSSYLSEVATAALGQLRPSAALLFPCCTNQLSSANPWERTFALQLLGCVSDERERAASLLLPYLVSPSPPEAESAWRSLLKLGPAAVVAVPQLTAWLTNGTPGQAGMAVKCLGSIGPGASNALPALRRYFEAEKSESVRLAIAAEANAINPRELWTEAPMRARLNGMTGGQAGEEAGYALTILRYSTNLAPRFERELGTLARTGEKRSRIAWSALDALCRANLDAARKLPVVTDCLTSTNAALRAAAAGWLLNFQPANAQAFAGVTNALAGGAPDVDQEWLLGQLVKLGPAAAPALPLLRQLHARTAMPIQREQMADAIHALERAL